MEGLYFMKHSILSFTLLINTALSPALLGQNKPVCDISWTIAAQIPSAPGQTLSPGLAGAIIGTINNKLIIAGGTNFPDKMPWNGGRKNYYNDIFIYSKTPEGLVLKATDQQLKLPFNLAYAAVCNIKNGMVIAGGENENGLSNKVSWLSWKAGEFVIHQLPNLPKPLTNAALTVVGNKLYLAGGEMENGATAQFLSLNLDAEKEGWKELPNLPQATSHTVLLNVTQDSKTELFLIGGRKKNLGDTSTLHKAVYAFDLKKQVWTTKTSLPYPLSAATGIVKGKSILVFSGDRGETFHQAERLIAEIDREKDLTKKEYLNQQKIKVQSNHPGFSKTVLKYDLTTGAWTELPQAMPYGTVTTTAVLLNNEVIIAGGEIKAGVRTPNILVGKLKTTK